MSQEYSNMIQIKRIFIIGHPGAGKALLAKTVAENLGWQFIDADFGLEIRLGRTLAEIVGEQGVESFYACQSELLQRLLLQEHIVVTTDASIICGEKNRNLLLKEFVVYLKVSTKVQIARNARDPDPLLLNTEITTFIDKLHQERDHLFNQVSHLTIRSDDSDPGRHVARILQVIAKDDESKVRADRVILHKKDRILFHKFLHVPVELTSQQAACLKLLAEGKSAKDIARSLSLSFRTVEAYLAKTMELTGCTSSKELMALYHDQP